LLLCSSHSYSNEVFGVTQNATSFGYQWVMTNILPQQAGLQVNAVIYNYSVDKVTEDDFLVHVQNENAQGEGYIFRETDDWSGIPGNTINKNVAVPNIDISYWGLGSIETEGKGTVYDAGVYYSYQFDPCFDPQSNPSCPGYESPVDLNFEDASIYDPLADDMIQNELDRKANLKQQKEDEERRERLKIAQEAEERSGLESLLGIEETQYEFSEEQIALHQQLMALRGLPVGYLNSLVGGSYEDTITLKDKELPNNRRGLRVGLAQELKHQQLINLQYAK